MKKSVPTHEAYLKYKLKKQNMKVEYNKGKEFGIENATFNFTAEPVKEPYGDVAFITGYDNNPDYTSTFLMTCQEAMELGKMIMDAAYDAMYAKNTLQKADSYEAQLSFLVLKGLTDTIRISRSYEKLENYELPYYKYTITAYKEKDKLLSYSVVLNLSYFTSENEIDYWKDRLTDKGRVKLFFDNWNPYEELEKRKEESQAKLIKSLEKQMKLKPTPIKK